MPKPVAVWNSARDVWETPQTEGFFCEHLDVFSATFPTSGMTANGVAYELPTWDPATDGSGSLSLLPTVTTQDGANNGGPSQFDRNTPPLNTRVLMLPTPTTSDTNGAGKHGDGGLDLRTSVSLLPTTRAQHGEDRNSNIYPRPLDQPQNLENSLARLLPTPTVGMMLGGSQTRSGDRSGEMLLPGVAKQIGESTSPPSDAGSAPLDGQLRGQLNLLDAITDTD